MTDQYTHDDLTVAQTAQDELAEMEARWKRAAADLANYRKRAERDLAQQRQHERAAVLADRISKSPFLPRAAAV